MGLRSPMLTFAEDHAGSSNPFSGLDLQVDGSARCDSPASIQRLFASLLSYEGLTPGVGCRLAFARFSGGQILLLGGRWGVSLCFWSSGLGGFLLVEGGVLSIESMTSQRRRARQMTAALCIFPCARFFW